MTDTIQIETTEQDSRILFVPLNKLKKSPRNARKGPHSEATIAARAASTQHKGLIQNACRNELRVVSSSAMNPRSIITGSCAG